MKGLKPSIFLSLDNDFYRIDWISLKLYHKVPHHQRKARGVVTQTISEWGAGKGARCPDDNLRSPWNYIAMCHIVRGKQRLILGYVTCIE